MDFLSLYDENYQKVRKFILTLTRDDWAADDLIQETFIRVRQNISKIQDKDKAGSWIYRIAYNLCMDHLNKRKKETIDAMAPVIPPVDPPLIRRIEQFQMGACIQEKMNRLPEPMRIIIDLYDIMGFTHKEIAGVLSISEENSKVRLHRARKELKAILNQECALKYDDRNVFVCEPIHPDPVRPGPVHPEPGNRGTDRTDTP